jgi:hypothetical protein
LLYREKKREGEKKREREIEIERQTRRKDEVLIDRE